LCTHPGGGRAVEHLGKGMFDAGTDGGARDGGTNGFPCAVVVVDATLAVMTGAVCGIVVDLATGGVTVAVGIGRTT